jgi:uncharacterized short protein YbdD (DUF466 family)
MPVSRFFRRLADLARALRRIIGAPDYEAYVAHLRARHPDTEPLTCDQFYRVHFEDRYNRPGAKCC